MDPPDDLPKPGVRICQPHRVEVALAYRGVPLANRTVELLGFGFTPDSLTADDRGVVAGTVFFSSYDPHDLQVRVYRLVFGGVEAQVQGPTPFGSGICS
jgi:hypothetical protein